MRDDTACCLCRGGADTGDFCVADYRAYVRHCIARCRYDVTHAASYGRNRSFHRRAAASSASATAA